MILVDTSVWVDHLRSGEPRLTLLLEQGIVAIHDFVIGEIACGNLNNRQQILSLLQGLPRCEAARHDEVLFYIEHHQLMGRGIGYIDAALLAAAKLAQMHLWTRDKRLAMIAHELDCSWSAET